MGLATGAFPGMFFHFPGNCHGSAHAGARLSCENGGMNEDEFTNLHGLKRALNLPYGWLHREALAGRLPCLRIGRQLRFNFHAGSGLQPRPAAVGAVSEPQARARGPPRVRSFGVPGGAVGDVQSPRSRGSIS